MAHPLRHFISRLVPSGGTGQRAAKSAVWLFGQTATERLLPLILLLVLARLVGPYELGLVGIALVSMSALRSLTDVGLTEALIQRAEANVDSYLDTVLVLELGRNLLIFAVLFVGAPFIGRLFGAPGAVPLVQVLAFSPVLRGLKSPAVVYFQKNLEYHRLFVYTTSGTVAFFLVGIVLVAINPSAWAWVGALLAADVVRLVVSYTVHDYRPGLGFSTDAARDLIGFGKWMTASSILYFLYNEGDDVFMGWLLSPVFLAYYQYAYRLSNAPTTDLSQVISGVMFPAFSKHQADIVRLRESFSTTIRLVSFIVFPVGIGFVVVAPAFVASMLGSDWLPMVVVMQILALYGTQRSIDKVMGSLWKAVGRPDLITKTALVKVLLIAVCIYPVTVRWGIVGTATLLFVVNLVVMLPLNLFITSTLLETRTRRIVTEMTYSLVAAVAMGALTWHVSTAIALPAWVELAVLIPTGVLTYALAVLLVDHGTNWGMRANLRTVVAQVVG